MVPRELLFQACGLVQAERAVGREKEKIYCKEIKLSRNSTDISLARELLLQACGLVQAERTVGREKEKIYCKEIKLSRNSQLTHRAIP
jgi:hypothetical protein